MDVAVDVGRGVSSGWYSYVGQCAVAAYRVPRTVPGPRLTLAATHGQGRSKYIRVHRTLPRSMRPYLYVKQIQKTTELLREIQSRIMMKPYRKKHI